MRICVNLFRSQIVCKVCCYYDYQSWNLLLFCSPDTSNSCSNTFIIIFLSAWLGFGLSFVLLPWKCLFVAAFLTFPLLVFPWGLLVWWWSGRVMWSILWCSELLGTSWASGYEPELRVQPSPVFFPSSRDWVSFFGLSFLSPTAVDVHQCLQTTV